MSDIRELTLHEKITFKGLLARKNVGRKHLVRLNITGVLFIFKRLYGINPLQYHKVINHRKTR